jgi:predicted Zn finger-like uncharacterized protein
LFTQCSNCDTVFKLSADVLRAAGGQVRCGKCGEVFNALAHLAEDASVFATGESAIDLEARADSILESPAPPRPSPQAANAPLDFANPGKEVAQLQILDWNDEELANLPGLIKGDPPSGASGEISMEFTLPPGELDRIFVESKTRKRLPVPPLPAEEAQTPPAIVEAIVEPKAHPEEVQMRSAANRVAAPSGFEVPEDVRLEMLSGLEPHVSLRSPGRKPGDPAVALWLTAAVASGLLLAAQVIHQNREWLSHHAPFGSALSALYSRLGAPVPPPANLSAYQLRQWGVTGDPAADGTLRVRASILNTAAQLEPYPLLRVTLANRFGSSIGARDFEPAEYLGKPIAKLLAPGERVDATMDILDPGKNAEGFEIDVCLRGADRKISCANDAAPAQAKR